EELARRLAEFKTVAVFDRAVTLAGGKGGPLCGEIAATLYGQAHRPRLVNYVYGLGGRDLTQALVDQALEELAAMPAVPELMLPVRYLGLHT
ncbi:MAG: pyruvate ferredoxin oxidoreductase, partial [Clostridia bacterium]|nr:pyruvate ferredoxin oxidoreductase [Clostridia bacterium]